MPARYTRMAAARISTDVLEMFYGPISQEKNRRQKRPIEPTRIARDRYIDFNLERNNFTDGFVRGKSTFPEIIHPAEISCNSQEIQKRGLQI